MNRQTGSEFEVRRYHEKRGAPLAKRYQVVLAGKTNELLRNNSSPGTLRPTNEVTRLISTLAHAWQAQQENASEPDGLTY